MNVVLKSCVSIRWWFIFLWKRFLFQFSSVQSQLFLSPIGARTLTSLQSFFCCGPDSKNDSNYTVKFAGKGYPTDRELVDPTEECEP